MTRDANRWSVILLVAAFATACVSTQQVEPGTITKLGANQGFLVVEIDTNADIERIAFGGTTAAERLEKGKHLKLLVVPAGNYRWTDIEVFTRNRTIRFRARRRSDLWKFSVRAGKVSYPGRLILRLSSGYAWRLDARCINRSTEVYETLQDTYPDLVAEYQIEYTGRDRDDFLKHFHAALSESAVQSK